MTEMLDALSCLAVACILIPLGVWGRAHADDLIVPAVLGEDREQRANVLRRGAGACQVVGVVFAVTAVLLLRLG